MPNLKCGCGHVVVLTEHQRSVATKMTCPNCGETRKLRPVATAIEPVSLAAGEAPPARRQRSWPFSLRWMLPLALIALLTVLAAWYGSNQPLRIKITSLSAAEQQALVLVRKHIQDDNPKIRWDEVRWWGCVEINTCRYCRLKYRKIQRGPFGEFEVTRDEVFRVTETAADLVEPGRRTFDGATASLIQWDD